MPSGNPYALPDDPNRPSLRAHGVEAGPGNALTEILHNLKRGALAALILGRRRRGKTSILATIAHDPDIRKDYVILEDSVGDLPFCVWQEYLAHFGGLIWPTSKLLILR